MKRQTFMACLTILLLVQVPAVSGGQAGQLKRNLEMEQAFKDGNPPADYRYYATGRENAPDAIIGLDPAYRQTARLWREIDGAPGELGKLIQNVMRYYQDEPPRASDIVSPDGNIIGVYWSSIFWTAVEMGPDNGVKIFKPRPPKSGR